MLRLLKATRQRKGVIQQQLAARLGQTQSFVSKCERGERRLDVVELRAFCQALGQTLSRFVRELERELSSRSR